MKKLFTIVLFAILLSVYSPVFGQWPVHTIDPYLFGATIVDVADIDADGDLDVAATTYKADIVVWYENNQLNWTEHTIDSFLDNAIGVFIADINNDDTLDIAAAGYVADEVVWYKNTNASQTWTKYTIDTYLNGAQVVYVEDIDGDGDRDVVATGTNEDAVVWYENVLPDPSWPKHTIDGNLSGALSCHVADIDGDNDPDVAATGYYAHDVVWYENGGGTPINWTRHNIDINLLGAWEIRDADLDGDNLLDLVATGRGANDVVWYKNNGGVPITWTKDTIDGRLNGAVVVDIADIDLDSDLDVFATGFDADNVVWYKNNGGTPITWTKDTIDANLDGAAHIYAIDINNDNYPDAVVTGQNANNVVWYENLIIPGSIEKFSDVIPFDCAFSQNYPNPFNPITTIEFSIPKTEFVSLKIYNILGQEITTLISENLIPGNYKYSWDAGSFTSGLYMYHLQRGDFVETRKMVLMR